MLAWDQGGLWYRCYIRPFLICLKPLFHSEAKCEAIDMKMNFILMQVKNKSLATFVNSRMITSPSFIHSNPRTFSVANRASGLLVTPFA